MASNKGRRGSVAKPKRKPNANREFEAAAEAAAQRLIFDVQYVLQAWLQDKAETSRALAKKIGRTEATISRELDEDSNLTLRTIAKIATALKDEFRVSSRHFEKMKAEAKVQPMYETTTATITTTATG